MRIQVIKGRIDDSFVTFGKDYNEIEEIEEFFDNCECSDFQIDISPSLEQNQIQYYIVERKKESKKPKKKPIQKNKQFNCNDILAKYNLNTALEGELSDDMKNEGNESQKNGCKYGEIVNKQLKLNVFYFNRQMFNLFANLEDVTSFILNKKEQNCKNLLVLEDIKDIFVAKHIRKAIRMTQTVPDNQSLLEEELDNDEAFNHALFNVKNSKNSKKQTQSSKAFQSDSDDDDIPQFQGGKFENGKDKRKSMQCNDAEIQDWLCEIGIKYDIDYRHTYGKKETNEYLTNCLLTIIKSKYKKDLGMYDHKNKEQSELAVAEGLTGYYDQQWVNILMSINQVSEKKAVGIAKEYKTVKQLMNAYKECDTEKQRELLLQTIQYKGEKGKNEKSLGKCISKKLHNIFVNDNPDQLVNL